MKRIDEKLLKKLFADAETSPRRRSHFCFHESNESPIHRMVMGIMPDSFFEVQRHPDKWELFTVLRGQGAVYTYHDDGSVLECVELGAETHSVEVPPNVWHNFVPHSACAVLEVKPGPYVKPGPEDTASFKGIH